MWKIRTSKTSWMNKLYGANLFHLKTIQRFRSLEFIGTQNIVTVRSSHWRRPCGWSKFWLQRIFSWHRTPEFNSKKWRFLRDYLINFLFLPSLFKLMQSSEDMKLRPIEMLWEIILWHIFYHEISFHHLRQEHQTSSLNVWKAS